jgi:hypothetical protein
VKTGFTKNFNRSVFQARYITAPAKTAPKIGRNPPSKKEYRLKFIWWIFRSKKETLFAK